MRKFRGFTLVEIAVVVAIAGILLVMGVKAATSALAATQRSATADNLKNVKNALLAYYSANHRFPCPDSGPAAGRDGQEDRTTAGNPATACLAGGGGALGLGTVPYTTLGLPKGQALDGYGNMVTYWVDTNASAPAVVAYNAASTYALGDYVSRGGVNYRSLQNGNSAHTPPNATYWQALATQASWVRTSAAFGCYKNAVGSRSIFTTPTPPPPAETANAVVVLISHGQNGAGAWLSQGAATSRNALPTGTPELGNTSAAPVTPAGYRDYPPSEVAGATGPIDDMVAFIASGPPVTTEASGDIKTYMSNMGRTDICN